MGSRFYRLLLSAALAVFLTSACGDDRADRAKRAEEALDRAGLDSPGQVVAAPKKEQASERPAAKPTPKPGDSASGNNKAQPTNEPFRHAEEPGPQQSRMVPSDYYHGDIDGPDKSRYVPPTQIHYDEGVDASRYMADDLYHADIDGPDKSRFLSDNDLHVDDAGPSKSRYLPDYFEHKEWGSDASTYMNPDDLEALEARDFANDPDWRDFAPRPDREEQFKTEDEFYDDMYDECPEDEPNCQ